MQLEALVISDENDHRNVIKQKTLMRLYSMQLSTAISMLSCSTL